MYGKKKIILGRSHSERIVRKKSKKQPLWRLWGEEKQDDAVYTVYLKKVRYHPGSSLSCNDSNDVVSHLEWETVRVRLIKAGTLEKLVESLANDSGELESTYINIFFATYRSFATPRQVLMLLLDRYKQLGSKKNDMPDFMKQQHRRTLIQALLVWLDMFPEDFYEPPQYLSLHQIADFAKKYLSGSMLELRALNRIEKYKQEETIAPLSNKLGWCISCEDNNNTLTCFPYEFLELPVDHFARQLTWIDAELFKKLVPHHCLGSIWSRREKTKEMYTSSTTVTATVNQFNALSSRVISTVLSVPNMKVAARSKIISKWIDIAQELRFLKNFSSLKAITAALQTVPVHRLKRVWLSVPREKVEVFSELARIFSEDNNQMNCRELLIKEGSAKFADTVGENDRQLQKAFQKQLSNSAMSIMQGTIPYLGTFLTDLMMIDAAIPDTLPDGLINFDKKRKEFEVLAQIKLLQSSANNYNIVPDHKFQAWFENLPTIDDNESYQLSYLIESHVPANNEKRPLHKSRSSNNTCYHKKNDSTSSTSTSSSNSQFYDQSSSDASMASITMDGVKPSASCSSLTFGSFGSTFALASDIVNSGISQQAPEFYIIRVSIEQDDRKEVEGVNLYKSIMLSNCDHTRTVIYNAMMKHGLVGNPDDYELAQLLPDGEIVFPSSANVYYAINTAYDLNFILRRQNNISQKRCKPTPLVKRILGTVT
ncbi:ral guanine nucleotide dissociation stimulator-like 1 isoform X1 [Centruroides vittatus]|uniref:ral guanine nucleotide dissociation stimulator-like 1 isoform X1 n=1 Tax=Centruroides vittatus TaxID=120091 RepID=UPI00350F61D5